jgi:hypothetical protein
MTNDMIELTAEQSNIYSVQKNGKCLATCPKEIEQLMGMYLLMGIVQMPGVRYYWEKETRYGPVAHVMSRNRFQAHLTNLHFVNTEEVTDSDKSDKLWKLRPILDMLRNQCRLITPEEHQSIDEMMVPYKGRYSQIRQYIKGKPNPWGFKIWGRCSASGLLHDFDVYQGKSGQRSTYDLGVGGDIVIQLCETLEKQKGYKIYADNLFSSMHLMLRMIDDGFHYTGTLRANRLGGCEMTKEKDLKKKGRGSFDFRVETDSNIVCVRWMDTKAVTLMSTYAGPNPLDKARRWDKTKKEYVEVDRPHIVTEYNSYMGGIDLLDSCVARYKYLMRSRRWYIILFWHTITLAVINAWLLYRRDCKLVNIAKKNVLNLRRFQACIATSLIEVNASRKRVGRPSNDVDPSTPSLQSPKVRRLVRIEPNIDARFDEVGHWPKKADKRRRCAKCKNIKTDTTCEKCNVPLCFTEKNDCYRSYHTK